jgi:hypothetical protein
MEVIMASSTHKAEGLIRRLKQQLGIQIAAVVLTDLVDTDEFPILKVVKGSEIVFVKIMTRDTNRVDGIGLPQRAYSPHKVIIFRDTTTSDAAAREMVSSEATRLGTKVEIWEAATCAVWADFAAATKVVEMFNDPINPLTNAQ